MSYNFVREQEYVGTDVDVLQKVVGAVTRPKEDIIFGMNVDEDGRPDQYGVGIGGKEAKGIYLLRKEQNEETTTFDMYRFGPITSNLFKSLQNEHGTEWRYAFLRSEWTVNTNELPLMGDDYTPEEDAFTEAVGEQLNGSLRSLQDSDTDVYTIPGTDEELPEPLQKLVEEPHDPESHDSYSTDDSE